VISKLVVLSAFLDRLESFSLNENVSVGLVNLLNERLNNLFNERYINLFNERYNRLVEVKCMVRVAWLRSEVGIF